MFEKSKKGIMVDFLVVVILAIIIFVPACSIASKAFFRLSDQASDNFASFTTALQQFADSSDESTTFLLILDQETAAVLFNSKESKLVFSTKETASSSSTDSYFWQYPEQQCQGKVPCACLCRAFDEGEVKLQETIEPPAGVFDDTVYNYNLPCREIACRDISSVSLSGSVAFYRPPPAEDDSRLFISADTQRYSPENRRILLRAEKQGGDIHIQEVKE